jgi:hypothetical protein
MLTPTHTPLPPYSFSILPFSHKHPSKNATTNQYVSRSYRPRRRSPPSTWAFSLLFYSFFIVLFLFFSYFSYYFFSFYQRSTIQNAATQQYVSAENSGTSNLMADRPVASTWESFEFVVYGGYFYIQSYINHNFIVFELNDHLLAASTTQSGGSVFAIISSALSSTTLSGSFKVYSVLNGRYIIYHNALKKSKKITYISINFVVSN